MKKLLFVLALCLITATSALAEPSMEWWDRTDARTTYQMWDFDGPYTTNSGKGYGPDFDGDGVGHYLYSFSPATTTNNPGTTNAFVHGVLATDDYNGQYIVGGQDGRIDVLLEINNFTGGLYKEGWVHIDYFGTLTDVSVVGHSGEQGEVSDLIYSDDQTGSRFSFLIRPNPDKEDIWFSVVSAAAAPALYSVEVDTICHSIPAPGAILLGTMGTGLVGWLRKRRTL